jgi:pimeloyl-ACP methyl ester carboxylesterase
VASAGLALAAGLGLSAPAAASTASGPPLSEPAASLAASLHCTHDVTGAGRNPVLLIPGTTLTPREFSWNYEPALAQRGIPYCTVRLPHHAMSDIQTSAEYVTYALRSMHSRSGRKVDVVGHSQGGMIGRWSLKFWPDTRDDVADVIGLDPSNHGTLDANALCAASCAPSFWQQRSGSRFLRTLNSGEETYPGIDYTNVYSIDDEVVVPNLPPAASSSLHTGEGETTNVAVQRICPVHVSEHLMMGTTDPVAYALVIDAITHDGPAAPSRIDRSVCTRLLMPGVNPARLLGNETRLASTVAEQVALYPHVPAEPRLASYAR